jgi:aromatic ring-cleaving dioxygenase
MNDQSPDGHHAHIYYDTDSRAKAEQLAETLTDGAWLGTPVQLKLQILSPAYRPEVLPSA